MRERAVSTSVKLQHDTVGEFWYLVKAVATPVEEQPIPVIEGPLGETTLMGVPVTNPLDRTLTFAITSSNESCFTTSCGNEIALGALATEDLIVQYTPHSLNLEEKAVITLSSEVRGQSFASVEK